MAKYALIDGTNVSQVAVADSEEGLGVLAQLFETVDVTSLVPQPSKGWTYEGGIFYPPKLSDSAKSLWNGAGFTDPNIIDAEVVEEKAAIEAPAEETSTTRKKK